MRVRYRILTSTEDTKAMSEVASSIADDIRIGRRDRRGDSAGAIGFVLAAAETPRIVLESDGEGEVDEVREMIREGRMRPSDLVDPGTGWLDARAFGPLVEICMEVEQQAARRARVHTVLWVVGGLVVLGLFGWMVQSLS